MRKKLVLLVMIFSCFSISFMVLSKGGTSTETIILYSEDFSAPITGWILDPPSGMNDWEIGTPPMGDYSGTGAALGTNIDFLYQDNANMLVEASSPAIDLSQAGLTNIKLTFWHWYNFSDSLNDGGGIYLYNGIDYINPLNENPSAVSGDIENINVILGLAYLGHPNEKGWAYNSSGLWKSVTIDLSAIGLTNSDFNITFIFGEKNPDLQTGLGWYIDDISIIAEKETNIDDDFPWIWILIIGGIIGMVIGMGVILSKRVGPRYDMEGNNIDGGDKFIPNDGTPTEGTPTDTTHTDTTPTNLTTPEGSGTPSPQPNRGPETLVITPPRIKWELENPYEDESKFNPLSRKGYEYFIWFSVPCTIKPAPNQVIVAHVEISVTVQCINGPPCTFSYDYWEAFKIDENKQAQYKDKHHVNHDELKQTIAARCPNCKTGVPLKYTVTRKHTVNLGTVENANWESAYDDAFAYLANGPPPESKASSPSTRNDATVQGSVTSFSEEGALVFEGTYTNEGFNSSYSSTLGQSYTWP